MYVEKVIGWIVNYISCNIDMIGFEIGVGEGRYKKKSFLPQCGL
jgi:hypothetical protein